MNIKIWARRTKIVKWTKKVGPKLFHLFRHLGLSLSWHYSCSNIPKVSVNEHGYNDSNLKCVTDKASGQPALIFALAFPISESSVEVTLIKEIKTPEKGWTKTGEIWLEIAEKHNFSSKRKYKATGKIYIFFSKVI